MSLGELARHASDASGLIELLARHPSAGRGAGEEVARAQRRALEALRLARESAESPFTVGLVGELSAGKSLLLGTLLGLPELLPVGDEAVTGNVTVVHARPAAPDRQVSRETSVRVEYFDEEQTVEYLRHLRDALATQAADGGLEQRLVDELRRVRLREPDCRELLSFRDAYLGGELAKSLAGTLGELDLIDGALRHVREAGRPLYGLTAELDDTLAGAAVVLPGPAEYRTLDPRLTGGAITAGLLRATMPLVRRVVRDVEVARNVWDVREFPGGELRLLDFPGLNSAFSAVRDQYVCGTELRSAHTILILLKTTGGATDTPERIRRMWQAAQRTDGLENSVLAAVSRFHELPVSEALLRPYVEYEGQLLRDRLLDGVPVLRDLLASAERLVAGGRSDRIVLTSAMRALSTGAGAQGIGPHFARARHLDTQIPLAQSRAAVWRAVGERLDADDVGGALGGMLIAFSEDGGIGRLRRALLDHVVQHGVALRLEQLAGHRAEASDALREVYRGLSAGPGTAPVDARAETEVRKRLTALLSVWQDVRTRSRTELLDARRLRLAGEDAEQGPTLLEELAGDAAEKVYAWGSWRRLLDAVQDEHVEPASLPDDRPPPLDADDLFTEFRDTCQEIEARNAPRLLGALENWLVGHQRRLIAAARELGTVITPEAFERLRSADPNDNAALVDRLSRATTLGWLRDAAEKAVRDGSTVDAAVGEARLRDRFPLRLGQALPWHPDSRAGTYARHQTVVARYRRDMAAMVLHESLGRLADAQRAVAARLGEQADAFIAEMREGQVTNALVTAVVGDTRAEADTAGFAEQLRRLADLSVYSWQRGAWAPEAGLSATGPDPTYLDVFHGGGE
ncbi:dynamin family protein [Streptomyces sp. NPDC001530]|uniref:dynamin family protein n=1 Tax=Streptomyces sp. NPDC001530 TaxID=3364582 RepID=UPI00367B8324